MAAYQLAVGVARQQGSHAATVSTLLGLAGVARERGDLVTAERNFAEARGVAETRLAPGAAVAWRLAVERGFLDLAQVNPAPAFASFDSALRGSIPLGGKVTALIGRATSELAQGKADAALEDARSALAIAESLQGAKQYSVRTGGAWLELALVLQARGDVAGATNATRTAVEHLSHTVDTGQVQFVAARDLQRRLQSNSVPHS